MDPSANSNASRGSKRVGYRVNPLLIPPSWLYSLLIRARNGYYDRVASAVRRTGVPVVSIGNITVGGTGKTPLVIEIVRLLKALGRKPAILTRGYGAAAGETADEVLEFQESLPDVPVVVNPDRVAGAKTAQQEYHADCLMLDDGFQHRRLHRDLNIVVIDALNPWGGGAPDGDARNRARLLPAGRLREPLTGLKRADLFVLSRVNQANPASLRAIRATLQHYAPAAPVITAGIEVAGWRLHGADVPAGNPPPSPTGRRLLPVCGIGNPETFLRLLETWAASCGATCAAPLIFDDHYRYWPIDVDRIQVAACQQGADWVVTTRKDWVKLAALWPSCDNAPAAGDLRLCRLDVRLALDDSQQCLDAALAKAVELNKSDTAV